MTNFMEFSSVKGNFLEMKEVWAAVADFAINAWNGFHADEQAKVAIDRNDASILFNIDDGIFGIVQLDCVGQDDFVGKIELMDKDTAGLNESNRDYDGHRLIGTAEFFFQRSIKTIVADPDVHPNIALDEAYIEKFRDIAELAWVPAPAS